jgi:hypothetical protein
MCNRRSPLLTVRPRVWRCVTLLFRPSRRQRCDPYVISRAGWKALVEKLFQRGLLKVVFATETLAAGINMPARTTVIANLSRRRDGEFVPLQHNELLQMAGRAGRRGFDTQGHCVLLQSRCAARRGRGEVAHGKMMSLMGCYLRVHETCALWAQEPKRALDEHAADSSALARLRRSGRRRIRQAHASALAPTVCRLHAQFRRVQHTARTSTCLVARAKRWRGAAQVSRRA